MANFETNSAITATATTLPATYSEPPPPDPGGTSNLDSTQNQLYKSLAKAKKTLWKLA